VLRLHSHDTTTPLSLEILVLVKRGLEGLNQDIQVLLVLLLGGTNSSTGTGFLSNQLTELGLSALDDAESNTSLSTEGREEEDEFDGIDIVSDEDEFGLLLLDELGDVVDSVLEDGERTVVGGFLLSSHFLDTLLLGGLGLRSQLLAQLDKLGHLSLVKGVLKLSDGRRDL